MPFGDALVDAFVDNPDLVVLSADLSTYTDVAPFLQRHPERVVQVGLAEQNLMGVAGGLSKSGMRPVAVTYCVFATRRAFEQVAMALCTGGRGGVVMAFLPGITTPFRATHQGTEDLALMRTLPGMTVVDPLDACELYAATHAAVQHDGPVYLRGLRGAVPMLGPKPVGPFRFPAARVLRQGEHVGIIGTGLGSRWALEATDQLEAAGIRAGVLHVPVLKPLPRDVIASYCAQYDTVATVENHSIVGGLGSAVAEVIADQGIGCRLRRLGVPDQWGEAGSIDYVRRQLGLDGPGLAATIAAAVRGSDASALTVQETR